MEALNYFKKYAGKFYVCLGGITIGISVAWTSPVLPQLKGPNSPIIITTEEESWIGSCLAIGSLFSAIPAGYLADKFGRKTLLIILVIPSIIFTCLVLFASNVYYLYAARIFHGFSTGGISAVGPMYIGETADVNLRGFLGTFFEMLIYAGILITAVLGAYLPYTTLTLVLGIFTGILGAGFFLLPESPTYLLMKKNRAKAEKALKFYRGNETNINEELELIQKDLDEVKNKEKVKIWKVWTSKASRRSLVSCVGLTIFQQFSGVDAITFYCVSIFQNAGTKIDPYTSSILVTITELISCFVAIFVIEKLKRKTFLYISAFGTGVSLAVMGAYFHLKSAGQDFLFLEYVPIVFMMLFFLFFALGLGPIPWLVNSELFSTEIKGPANGITIASNWVFLFLVTKAFPILTDKFETYFTFYVFAFLMMICLVFIKFCVPETKDKTLQQIQQELKS